MRELLAHARRKHVTVIAEGIESAAQHAMLLELGCEYGQGYAFGKPEAAEHVAMTIEVARAE